MPGFIDITCDGHPYVRFRLHPTEDRYLGICNYCDHEQEVFPLVEDPTALDLVTAWQRLEHIHK